MVLRGIRGQGFSHLKVETICMNASVAVYSADLFQSTLFSFLLNILVENEASILQDVLLYNLSQYKATCRKFIHPRFVFIVQ